MMNNKLRAKQAISEMEEILSTRGYLNDEVLETVKDSRDVLSDILDDFEYLEENSNDEIEALENQVSRLEDAISDLRGEIEDLEENLGSTAPL